MVLAKASIQKKDSTGTNKVTSSEAIVEVHVTTSHQEFVMLCLAMLDAYTEISTTTIDLTRFTVIGDTERGFIFTMKTIAIKNY